MLFPVFRGRLPEGFLEDSQPFFLAVFSGRFFRQFFPAVFSGRFFPAVFFRPHEIFDSAMLYLAEAFFCIAGEIEKAAIKLLTVSFVNFV